MRGEDGKGAAGAPPGLEKLIIIINILTLFVRGLIHT